MKKQLSLRRLCALLLALCMVCTLLPTVALSEDVPSGAQTVVTEQPAAETSSGVPDETEEKESEEVTPPYFPGSGN